VSIAGRPGALSNGEYVMNAKATKKIGLKKLDRMNLGGLPKGSKMKNGVHVEPTTKLASGGISAQTQVAIKRLDDEDDPNSVPRAPEAQPERTSQGMTAQRPMSPAQKEQLRQLILLAGREPIQRPAGRSEGLMNIKRLPFHAPAGRIMAALKDQPELFELDTFWKNYPNTKFGDVDTIYLRFPDKRPWLDTRVPEADPFECFDEQR